MNLVLAIIKKAPMTSQRRFDMSQNMKNHENCQNLLFSAIFPQFHTKCVLMGNNVRLDIFLMNNNWNKNKILLSASQVTKNKHFITPLLYKSI